MNQQNLSVAALGLAAKANGNITNGVLPYVRTNTYSAGTVGKKLQETISVKDFGAKGDGTTDDTTALQAFVDYLALNRAFGRIPKGTYRITAPLTTYRTDSWGFAGDGPNITIIQQDTNNVGGFGGTEDSPSRRVPVSGSASPDDQ